MAEVYPFGFAGVEPGVDVMDQGGYRTRHGRMFEFIDAYLHRTLEPRKDHMEMLRGPGAKRKRA